MLPLGFLLTQYTITGLRRLGPPLGGDPGAANGAAKGIWQSIFYSAIGGWILLLAFVFAATNVDVINSADPTVNPTAPSPPSRSWAAPGLGLFKLVVFISMAGQFFCTIACMTITTRMLFAFSRDGAVPWPILVDAQRNGRPGTPSSSASSLCCAHPSCVLQGIERRPIAFFAVVSIGVIGLYGPSPSRSGTGGGPGDSSPRVGGPWARYRWMNPVAVAEIAVTSVTLLPSRRQAAWKPGFTWKAVNYTPLVVLGALILLWIGWHLSVKNWFTGPKRPSTCRRCQRANEIAPSTGTTGT